jgi:hypothetical protein
MEVQYEDLVNDPESTMKKVLRFIGEPYEESIMEYYKVGGRSRDEQYFDHSSEATKPIHRQSVGRWKSELTTMEQELFMRRAGDLMRELGYA